METQSTRFIAAHELLCMQHCPQCDYELRGLPEQGVCPECGFNFDKRNVVLRGQPLGGFRSIFSARRYTWRFFIAMGLSWGVLLYLSLFGRHFNPYLVMPLIYGGVLFIVDLFIRLNSVRDDVAIVWICDEGVGQAGEGDPSTIASRLRPVMPVFYLLMCTTWVLLLPFLVVPGLLRHWSFPITLLVMIALILLGLRSRERMLYKFRATSFRPGLVEWPEIGAIALRSQKGEKNRLIVRTRKRFLGEHIVVDIELGIPAIGITELANLLRQRAPAAKFQQK